MKGASDQRGIALLLVLVALVLSVTAAAGLARVAATARLRHDAAATTRLARELLDAVDAPVLDWLHRHAGRLVLPPDAVSPRFLVLDDTLDLGGVPCRLTITAFGQCGMVPVAEADGRLAAMLPGDAHRLLARAGSVWTDRPGLDVLVAVSGGADPVFPGEATAALRAIGECVATHNPSHRGRVASLNVNTAPLDLVAAVYAAHGLGGIDAVAEARAQGRVVSPGTARAPRSNATRPAIVPVSMSTAWAFRVDCRAGSTHESWWCVYADTGSNWERVQRLAITE